jgi:hypothetical protein
LRGWGGEEGVWGNGEEMTQTLYAHIIKIKIKKKNKRNDQMRKETE